jgi:hypothetical protein
MQTYREFLTVLRPSHRVKKRTHTAPGWSWVDVLIGFKRCTNNTLASVSLHDPWYRATANHAGIRTFRGTSDEQSMGRKLAAAVACSRLIALPEFFRRLEDTCVLCRLSLETARHGLLCDWAAMTSLS